MNPLGRLFDSPVFVGSVVAVILTNAVVLGLQTYLDSSARRADPTPPRRAR